MGYQEKQAIDLSDDNHRNDRTGYSMPVCSYIGMLLGTLFGFYLSTSPSISNLIITSAEREAESRLVNSTIQQSVQKQLKGTYILSIIGFSGGAVGGVGVGYSISKRRKKRKLD